MKICLKAADSWDKTSLIDMCLVFCSNYVLEKQLKLKRGKKENEANDCFFCPSVVGFLFDLIFEIFYSSLVSTIITRILFFFFLFNMFWVILS